MQFLLVMMSSTALICAITYCVARRILSQHISIDDIILHLYVPNEKHEQHMKECFTNWNLSSISNTFPSIHILIGSIHTTLIFWFLMVKLNSHSQWKLCEHVCCAFRLLEKLEDPVHETVVVANFLSLQSCSTACRRFFSVTTILLITVANSMTVCGWSSRSDAIRRVLLIRLLIKYSSRPKRSYNVCMTSLTFCGSTSSSRTASRADPRKQFCNRTKFSPIEKLHWFVVLQYCVLNSNQSSGFPSNIGSSFAPWRDRNLWNPCWFPYTCWWICWCCL